MATEPAKMLESDRFVPSDGSLLVRDFIQAGDTLPTDSHRKTARPSTTNVRPATFGGQRFGKLSMSSFFTRHNPHPRRVNHFKGLLDIPICNVFDFGVGKSYKSLEWPPNEFSRRKLDIPTESINVNTSNYPMDPLTGLHYGHSIKGLPFAGNTAQPVPQQTELSEVWRKELQSIADAAGLAPREKKEKKEPETRRSTRYSAATGRIIPTGTRGKSRGRTPATAQQRFMESVTASGARPVGGDEAIQNTVMMMLCQILQTDNIQAVQDWLSKAGEMEKRMVQELITAASSAEGHHLKYPLTEHMLDLDGRPMTPDIGTTIGEHVQNRLSTCPQEEQLPTIATGNEHQRGGIADESTPSAKAKLCQASPLPPIKENTQPEFRFAQTELTSPPRDTVTPLKTLLPQIKQSKGNPQMGFNAALENATKMVLEELNKNQPTARKALDGKISEEMSATNHIIPSSNVVTNSWQPDSSLAVL